jgi:hypothetical protein
MSPSVPDPSDPPQPSQPGFMQRMGQGYLQGMAQRSPLGNAVYNAFKEPSAPAAGPYARYQSPSAPPGATTPMAPPVPPAPDTSGGTAGGSQWGASAPKSGLIGQVMQGGGSGATGDGAADAEAGIGGDVAEAALLAGGGVITQPTLARIGERGPEAVVPLTPRPGNKMQPDLLEGHGAAPHVPGVKYSRYKSFNRFGSGGAA